MRFRKAFLPISIALSVAVAAVLAVGVAATASPDTASSRFFDDVPGLGMSPSAVLRDDTIALYESWERQRIMAACARSHGFAYEPELAYGSNAAAAVAESLGVTPVDDGRAAARDRNEAYRRSLPEERGQRFARIMWGDRMQPADHAADATAGRPGAGGTSCADRAADETAYLWQLKLDMEQDILEASAAAVSIPEFEEARQDFDRCVEGVAGTSVEHVAELEELEAQQPQLGECRTLWSDAMVEVEDITLEEVRDEWAPRIEDQQERYDGMVERIRQDGPFRSWLGTVAHDVIEAQEEPHG